VSGSQGPVESRVANTLTGVDSVKSKQRVPDVRVVAINFVRLRAWLSVELQRPEKLVLVELQ
jgi:hypothetical protein